MSRVLCRFGYNVEQDRTQTERSLDLSSKVEPSVDAQFRSPQSNGWSLQSRKIPAGTSDNSFMV